jgi:hypothetical protein
MPILEESSMFTHKFQKNDIETGRGDWKSLAAIPLRGAAMGFQVIPGLHVK